MIKHNFHIQNYPHVQPTSLHRHSCRRHPSTLFFFWFLSSSCVFFYCAFIACPKHQPDHSLICLIFAHFSYISHSYHRIRQVRNMVVPSFFCLHTLTSDFSDMAHTPFSYSTTHTLIALYPSSPSLFQAKKCLCHTHTILHQTHHSLTITSYILSALFLLSLNSLPFFIVKAINIHLHPFRTG